LIFHFYAVITVIILPIVSFYSQGLGGPSNVLPINYRGRITVTSIVLFFFCQKFAGAVSKFFVCKLATVKILCHFSYNFLEPVKKVSVKMRSYTSIHLCSLVPLDRHTDCVSTIVVAGEFRHNEITSW